MYMTELNLTMLTHNIKLLTSCCQQLFVFMLLEFGRLLQTTIVDVKYTDCVGAAVSGYGAARSRFQNFVENAPRLDCLYHFFRYAFVHFGMSYKTTGLVGVGDTVFDVLAIFCNATAVTSHWFCRNADQSAFNFKARLDLQQICAQQCQRRASATLVQKFQSIYDKR